MNSIIRKTMLASAVAALVSTPVWAAGDTYKGTETKTDTMHPTTQRSDTPTTQRSDTTTMPQGASNVTAKTATYDKSTVQAMTPDELDGKDVIGQTGDKVGEVKAVVRSRSGNEIEAVIAAGGFLGIGDKEITVPLDRLQYVDGKLHISATTDELKARPEYKKDQYVELSPKDQRISEFSAFETDSGARKMDRDAMHDSSKVDRGMTNAPTKVDRTPQTPRNETGSEGMPKQPQ